MDGEQLLWPGDCPDGLGAVSFGQQFSATVGGERRNKIFEIYERMVARAAAGPYEVELDRLTLTVLPKVYAPGFFTDTLWFTKQLPSFVGQTRLLEIGTGTGAIAIACALNGATVIATDINPHAVRNARLNAARYGLYVPVSCGDVFSAIGPREKFDFIFWLHPFNNSDAPVRNFLLRSGFDYNYEGLKHYIAGAKDHLAHGGRLLLGTADSADLQTIGLIAAAHGYTINILREARMSFEQGTEDTVIYLLCELLPANRVRRPLQTVDISEVRYSRSEKI